MAIVLSGDQLIQTESYLPRNASSYQLQQYSGLTQSYAAIYRSQPNVRIVVDFLSRNVAQLGLKVFERSSDTERKSLGDHAIGRLIRRPNTSNSTTRYDLIHGLVSDLGIYDQAALLKLRNPIDGRLSLWRLDPTRLKVTKSSHWEISEWEYDLGKDSRKIRREDVVFLRGYNPEDNRGGLSPIETVRQLLAEGAAASEYREQYWRQGARISGVIERPSPAAGTPKWSPEARERFINEWERDYVSGSSRAGGTPLLEDGMQFKQVAFSAKDSEYLEARKLSRAEVAAVYHVSPIFVGLMEGSNFSSVRELHRHLYQDTLGPTLRHIEESLTLQLVDEFDDINSDRVYFEFDLSDKLKGSFEERAQMLQAAVGGPYLTRNEARADENKPPIEGGDELIVPLNVIEGGLASPRDTAPKTDRGHVGTKADLSQLPEEVRDWIDAFDDVFASHLARQGERVVAGLGAGEALGELWNGKRWDTELASDLLTLVTELVTERGTRVAVQLGGVYELDDVVRSFVDENSTRVAKAMNRATYAELASRVDDLDEIKKYIARSVSERSKEAATTEVTHVDGFARNSGAWQAGATHKIWRVRSNDSRHPRLNGEKVEIGEKFSNGARWPGDSRLHPKHRVNCLCTLEIIREEPDDEN